MKHFLLLSIFLPVFSFGQSIKGKISDKSSGEALTSARISSSEGNKVSANVDGTFSIPYKAFPLRLIITSNMYLNDTIQVLSDEFINVQLTPVVTEIESMVVTASRREQGIEEVAVSMEILKPVLIDNKGITDLEQAVDQSPGVFAMDGQVSIRGGSGFSYGAGSRVLLLWNDVPILSGDAGDAKWNSIPMESASKIEVIKGASSVLYGSGALNGIIALTEKEPMKKPELKAKIQTGIYDDARRESLNWRRKNPTFQLAEVSYGRMFKKVGFNISGNGFTNKGYRDGESESRARVSGSVFFRPEKIRGLKAGIGYSLQYQKAGSFIIWQSDSLGYTPSGGSDTSNAASTLSIMRGIRLNIDPYIKYFDNKGNKHHLRTRLYRVDNSSYTNAGQSSIATNYYADYQYQKNWNNNFYLTSGLTSNISVVQAGLYGNHQSDNYSIYSQAEKRYKKLDLTAGVRFEYFQQDGRRGDSDYYLGKDSVKLPVFPIFRAAAHYQLFKFTHLRASFGQGVRYPTIAERFTNTSLGSLNIFPNQSLKRETGWAAEIGIKQGVKIGKWKGLLDVAGFVNEYDNMMEFAFGFYIPEGLAPSLNPNSEGYIMKWVGFQARNAEKARISGLEISFSSEGKIGEVELRSLVGYTYMNPISLNRDSAYRATFSDTSTNILKYRFNHLAKADIEAVYKNFSIGASMRYNSFMRNIDAVFEQDIFGTFILPGLKEYREKNNKGALVFDARIGYDFLEHYRVGFMVNNLLNTEYVGRPGDIQAPRSFMGQLQVKF